MGPSGSGPVQVLVAKLIDLVDNAVPWDSGPKYDPGGLGRLPVTLFACVPAACPLSDMWYSVQCGANGIAAAMQGWLILVGASKTCQLSTTLWGMR